MHFPLFQGTVCALCAAVRSAAEVETSVPAKEPHSLRKMMFYGRDAISPFPECVCGRLMGVSRGWRGDEGFSSCLD